MGETMTIKRRIQAWVSDRVPAREMLTIEPTYEWGDGFKAIAEPREAVVCALTTMLVLWERDRYLGDHEDRDETLEAWLESCLPLPLADE